MYSSPAIGYLIRKKARRKHKFVIQTKIIIWAYVTFGLYLTVKYLGETLMKIEPMIYAGLIAVLFSFYTIIVKPGGRHESR